MPNALNPKEKRPEYHNAPKYGDRRVSDELRCYQGPRKQVREEVCQSVRTPWQNLISLWPLTLTWNPSDPLTSWENPLGPPDAKPSHSFDLSH